MLCGSNSLPVSDHLEDMNMRLIKQQHACEAHWGFKTETQFSTSARNQGVVLLFVCVCGGVHVHVYACVCACMYVSVCARVYVHIRLCVSVCSGQRSTLGIFLSHCLPSFLKQGLTEPGTNFLIPPDWLPSESKIILGQPLQDITGMYVLLNLAFYVG